MPVCSNHLAGCLPTLLVAWIDLAVFGKPGDELEKKTPVKPESKSLLVSFLGVDVVDAVDVVLEIGVLLEGQANPFTRLEAGQVLVTLFSLAGSVVENRLLTLAEWTNEVTIVSGVVLNLLSSNVE